MKKYFFILKNTVLFAGIGENELLSMLKCLQAEHRSFHKNEYVFRQGERINKLTILLIGKLLIQKDDFWGNRSIINVVNPGDMFGEAYIAPESGALLNDVVAKEDSEVLFLDIYKMIAVCPNTCKFHSILIQNLFFAISEKNRNLVQKIGHISNRTTRNKLISYLSEESKKHNSETFSIPFSRQQLADFLSVDRSAMSNELCKMRAEGLLLFNKNQFTLLHHEELL